MKDEVEFSLEDAVKYGYFIDEGITDSEVAEDSDPEAGDVNE